MLSSLNIPARYGLFSIDLPLPSGELGVCYDLWTNSHTYLDKVAPPPEPQDEQGVVAPSEDEVAASTRQ